MARNLRAQHLALSKSEKAHSCRDQLEGAEEQLYLGREKIISGEAASSEATVWNRGLLVCSQKECDISL